MHLILCIDDRGGLSFCGKRQSSDRAVTEDILHISAGKKLWMSPYSAKLFPSDAVVIDEGFLQAAGQDEYCFLETAPLPVSFDNLESVILYRWNRHYPATVKLPEYFLKELSLCQFYEFPGHSHDKITMERYTL